MHRQRTFVGRSARGQSLLELVAATTIMALALVPALRMMRDSMRIGRRIETANLLATTSASLLEENLLATAVNWSSTTVTGNLASEGYPLIRFQVVCSDDAADGGIPGALMSITATTWEDRDNDGVLDAGELQSTFSSKLARIVAYQQEAAES